MMRKLGRLVEENAAEFGRLGALDNIAIANSTAYRLSAYLGTRDLCRAVRLAEELRTGVELINGSSNIQSMRPFGGLDNSGYGHGGGKEGLEEFLRVKTVGIKL